MSDPIHDEVCVLCHEKVSFCECWRCDECETLQPISDEVRETNLCDACETCLCEIPFSGHCDACK